MSKFVALAHYKPYVRIGNWFEEICREEEQTRLFKEQRATGQLLVDKTRNLFNNFHREINSGAPGDYVEFGNLVQLKPLKMNICEDNIKNTEPALSIGINERVVRKNLQISDECELTIAPTRKQFVRNSFRVMCTSGEYMARDDEEIILKYGQHFRLECINTTEPLYIYTLNKSTNLNHVISTTYQSFKNGESNLPLGLVYRKNIGPGKDIPLAATDWFCQHVEPKKRFETNLTPIPTNAPLVITHAATNRNLSAENLKIQTLFGTEFLVSVTNHKNVFGREKWNNIWKICYG